MSESFIVHCDQCQSDISTKNPEHSYRIKVYEEYRALIYPDLPEGKKELENPLNFCNLAHLKQWILENNNE